MTPLFIAEVKTKSPFKLFRVQYSQHLLLDLALEHGDIVAGHTEEPWGGSIESFREIATEAHACGKLAIAKGWHRHDAEVWDALDAGADLVLVVGRVPAPELAPVCIYEPETHTELMKLADRTQRVMWNSRELSTGERRHFDAGWALSVHGGWLCQASFITKPCDVIHGVDAFIVGEHLPTFVEAMS